MAKKSIPQEVYGAIIAFCKKQGLFEKLKKSLQVAEQDRFDAKKIHTDGLDILDAVHCVYDRRRSLMFLEEVARQTKKGDQVLEIGIGTGILSYMARLKGARVYGVEINTAIYSFSKKVHAFLKKQFSDLSEGITFLKKNALRYDPQESLDIIISENLYTGMFYEKQVQIMNRLVSFLKKDGTTVPRGMRMGIALAEVSFPRKPHGQEMFVPLDWGKKLQIRQLSGDCPYETLHFDTVNPEGVDTIIRLPILRSGNANAVIIWSEVLLGGTRIIRRKDTIFLNNDIVIALKKSHFVKKGDSCSFRIKYNFGSVPSRALLDIVQ